MCRLTVKSEDYGRARAGGTEMKNFEACCRIQAGREKGGPQLWLFQAARTSGEFEQELNVLVPRRRQSLIGSGINFLEPRMEDQQFPEQVTGDSRGVDGKDRAHKDTRPLTSKHVDTHAPFRHVRGRAHLCQIAKRRHKDTRTRFDVFPLQNFQEEIGEFYEGRILDSDDLETVFDFRSR